MMQDLKVLNSKAVKELTKKISSQFGFAEKLDYAYLEGSDGKVYLVNKELADMELKRLRIHSLGLCLGEHSKDGFVLTIEGSQLIGPKCTKNVIELPDESVKNWLKGENIEADAPDGVCILKCGKDFLGCGAVSRGIAVNKLDKNRRIMSED